MDRSRLWVLISWACYLQRVGHGNLAFDLRVWLRPGINWEFHLPNWSQRVQQLADLDRLSVVHRVHCTESGAIQDDYRTRVEQSGSYLLWLPQWWLIDVFGYDRTGADALLDRFVQLLGAGTLRWGWYWNALGARCPMIVDTSGLIQNEVTSTRGIHGCHGVEVAILP